MKENGFPTIVETITIWLAEIHFIYAYGNFSL